MQYDPRTQKLFSIVAPIRTHFRPAKSCEEVDCGNWRNGWKTVLDPSTPEGQFHIETIKLNARLFKFTIKKLPSGLIEYTFEPGQNCFMLSKHRVRLEDKPPKYYEKNRAGQVPVEYNHWQDDLAVQLEILKKERG